MRLSVIIPAYNALDKVLRCVNSLQKASTRHPDDEFLSWHIQDDCSPAYNLEDLIPSCVAVVYRNQQNLGFNGNVNTAVAHTSTGLIAIVNQDVFAVPQLSDRWDRFLVQAFDDPTVGIVGPKLLFPQGGIQSCGGEFDGHCQPTHRYLGYSDIAYPPANTPECVDWITGAFFVVRRTVWEQLGGFDPVYEPSYWEDVDFCLRAREAGWRTWYEPRAIFIHEVGSTGGSPHFMRGARAFHERWVATGKVKPSTPAVRERFW